MEDEREGGVRRGGRGKGKGRGTVCLCVMYVVCSSCVIRYD